MCEKGTNRTGEPRTSHVSACEVSDETQKKILDLEGAQRPYVPSAASGPKQETVPQNSTKGTEEQNQEGSSSRSTSPYTRNRNVGIGEVMKGRTIKGYRGE